jgi:thiol-disulfide isomerase/thioredoxin
LRYRSECDADWTSITTVVKGTSVRKKGLQSGVNYYFSIKPNLQQQGQLETMTSGKKTYQYSRSSEAMQVAAVSSVIRSLFPTELLCRSSPSSSSASPSLVNSADALAGKVVGIYFSAHWCQPCRDFTPRLAAFYQVLFFLFQ